MKQVVVHETVTSAGDATKTIILILTVLYVIGGDRMVGHKFIEALKEKDPSNRFNVVTFSEEKRAAYNRMRLTEVSTAVLAAAVAVISHIGSSQ